MKAKGLIFRLITLSIVLLLAAIVVSSQSWKVLLMALAALLIFMLAYDRFQSGHSLLRNFPLLGRVRYLAELIRPEIHQYFIESDTDGRPFNRRQRSLVYQRAKNVKDSISFGTQLESGKAGYEWVEHSLFPTKVEPKDLQVNIGGSHCLQPYTSSLLNIGAMSFGALSKTAIESLGQGARMGGFAMNTGEGGISPYHLDSGAHLIWQIGTGYFGCRNEDGSFSSILFQQKAEHPNVKMIEIKLSQGAKPGRGGLLPAAKNTPEIAGIRNIEPWKDVVSPASHAAFHGIHGLLTFISYLRELSGGKPIGIKLCVGSKQQVQDLIEAMANTGLMPDFITVDGAEGGTGAAPLEFSDHLGMPLFDALSFVSRLLKRYNLQKEVKLMAAGKIVSGFDIMKVLALGADLCYSARGMMMALGCIQALQCDSGTCPVGIATQDRYLMKGIVVTDKRERIKNFHENTLKATADLMGACGFAKLSDIHPSKFHKRIDTKTVLSLEEIYFLKYYMSHRNYRTDLLN